MKVVLLFLIAFSLKTQVEGQGFYGIKFKTINGVLLNTNSFMGKKVIVALLGVNQASQNTVNYLDSVQRARPDIQVVAVPTGEFGSNITMADLVELQKRLRLVISEPLKVKKVNGAQQHPFFVWLTDAKKNNHFDLDADEEGKAFFISPKGTLYAVISTQTKKAIASSIINQPFND